MTIVSSVEQKMELATLRKFALCLEYLLSSITLLEKNAQAKVVQMEEVVLQDLGSAVYFLVFLMLLLLTQTMC